LFCWIEKTTNSRHTTTAVTKNEVHHGGARREIEGIAVLREYLAHRALPAEKY
jgi:hypothetical protein